MMNMPDPNTVNAHAIPATMTTFTILLTMGSLYLFPFESTRYSDMLVDGFIIQSSPAFDIGTGDNLFIQRKPVQ
jgi:hypothetical protein